MSREVLVLILGVPAFGIAGWIFFRLARAAAIIRSVDEIEVILYCPVRGVNETIQFSEITFQRTLRSGAFPHMKIHTSGRKYWINLAESGKENVKRVERRCPLGRPN
jgi:hypothetical protein